MVGIIRTMHFLCFRRLFWISRIRLSLYIFHCFNCVTLSPNKIPCRI